MRSGRWPAPVVIVPSAWADLLIAILANAHDVTLLHYDADFEIAAEVLPFQHRWALEPGAIS
ncbi:hypothetical protein [Mycolicibacterium frederiksbergense]|jgi:predicted nucleic acid-binding protein|uniref:hypothetical protein n=1 Tax=Mycolicibacterium frederiksbergense TaxID=117567 RepID=UPI00265CCCEB|nr:hypothetical protein [Mycolicibacterium frederiksbergense]